jgi:uncharacterized membrane protein YraQ (UPF0718 family)
MVIDIVLSFVIATLMGLVAYLIYTQQKEREKLLKMFMAKDLREVTDNEVMEKTKEPEPYKPPDSMSMDDAIDDEVVFDRHIAAVKLQAKEELAKEYEK